MFSHQKISIRALIAGNKQSWDQFVEQFSPIIYSAISKVLTNSHQLNETADDLFQEVFIKLCRNDFQLLKAFDPKKAKLSTWLTIIARSTTIDSLRRKHIQQTSMDEAESIGVEGPQYPSKFKLPEHILSNQQKLILTLLYEQDMTVAEIAHTLDVKQQTVRSQHHKALTKLRQHVEKD